MKKTLQLTALALAAALGTSIAHAEAAGSWLVKGGVMTIRPDVDSGDLTTPSLPGTKVDVGDDTQLAGGITYMFSDHWAVELPLAAPFTFDLEGDGAVAGIGKIGEVKALPVTVFGQYRFLAPESRFHPYVGL
ncbi:MAG TPA: OmpW family outer membrane protein, partial [Moraxellaceae bacterium]